MRGICDKAAIIIRSSHPEVFLTKSMQENTHAEVQFRQSCCAALLKSHFNLGVLLQICSMFSEHLFLATPLGGCFCIVNQIYSFSSETQSRYLCRSLRDLLQITETVPTIWRTVLKRLFLAFWKNQRKTILVALILPAALIKVSLITIDHEIKQI